MTTWELSRWSREWVGAITVTADGAPVTTWTYTIVRIGEQPASEAAINLVPTALDGDLGVLVGPDTAHELTLGRYHILVRYVDNPEAPVLTAGTIVIV